MKSLSNWFRYLLPPSGEEVVRRVRDSLPSSPTRAPERHVLFVEDDEFVCEIVTRLIRKFNCTVVTALDGKAALTLFEPKKFDIIILDLRLPDMPGVEVLRSIRKIDPEQPVAIFSGFLDSRMIDEVYAVGWAFLGRKPFDLHDGKVLRMMLRTVGITPKAEYAHDPVY